MFGWLKKKLNSFVPTDINKGMLTSNFCNVKIGSTITIPSGVICYVSYLDKIYLELIEGTYILNEATLPTLYKKQLGKKDKIKHIKVDFFFVNLSSFNLSLVYIDKIPINNKLTKLTATANFTCSVSDARLFRDVVLSHFASVYAYQTERLVMDFSEEFLRNFFLHKKLNSCTLDAETNNELVENFTKYLAKMGVKLTNLVLNFQPFVTKQPSNPEKEIKRGFFDDSPTTPSFDWGNHDEQTTQVNQEKELEEEVKETAPVLDQAQENAYNTTIQQDKCPRCGCKMIKGSIYCHRCGYKFN
ncbi:MAG: hypothetical protein MJ152_02410 [Clostridia bacterium]|nr:hypothetical protein [Clostridia bacterium]